MTPTTAELEAYRRGTLALARFHEIDGWLATLPADEQVRLLTGDEPAPLPGGIEAGEVFRSDAVRGRYVLGDLLGKGGMGEVRLARDVVLDRAVAIKLCRPRAPDEALADHAARLRAFRREAAITAQLEHPAIVPVHDAGVGPLGEPAYVMKRVEGRSLDLSVHARAQGRAIDLAETVGLVLRIAEAMAHAHQRGIVHRDLKPANVVVGELGALAVLDWGLAARTGEAGERAGTPAWMAPEQAHGAPADPRMDVFALGGLLLALLTGAAPRPSGAGAVDLSPLQRRAVPRGLDALIRSCLAADPAQRPADGALVAGELRRWLSAGVTAAEQPGPLRRSVMRIRRSPRALATVITVLVLLVIASGAAAWNHSTQRDIQRARLRILAATPLDDLAGIRAGLAELGALTSPLPEARALSARFQAAIDAEAMRAEVEQRRRALLDLAARYRERGPWTGEIDALRTALASNGITFTDPTSSISRLRSSPLKAELRGALVQLQRALLLDDAKDPATKVIPKLLAGASDEPAWRALAELLAMTHIEAHDLVLCECPASEGALADPVTADLLLATYGPEPRLVRHAAVRLIDDPGAFWPRIISARAAYDARRDDEARSHALVALGREAHSLWPHLVLAYLALRANDSAALRQAAEAGLAANADHLELRLLLAIARLRAGDRTAVDALIADPGIASHLQYHRQHPHGHPMEDAVAALIAAGITLPDAPAAIGPLVPGHEHHH